MKIPAAIVFALLLAGFVSLAVSSARAQQFTPLYTFCASGGTLAPCDDGEAPQASLIQASDGNFYGTTSSGGAYGQGTIFEVTTGGTLTTLYSFCSGGIPCTDGAGGASTLLEGPDHNFYGTTPGGGNVQTHDLCMDGKQFAQDFTCGTVFQLIPNGENSTLNTLYSFCATTGVLNGNAYCPDGANPSGGLALGDNNTYYGVTAGGNAGGTIFTITPTREFSTLYSFCDQAEGCTFGPGPLVRGRDENFYGTTGAGFGQSVLNGSVFQLTPSGSLTNLAYFCNVSGCLNGGSPGSRLVEGTDGNFYGTATDGYLHGSIFSVPPTGGGATLYTFCAQIPCADGVAPYGALIQGTDLNFYGTTYLGGTGGQSKCISGQYGCGTIYKFSPTTKMLTTLHNFCDGQTYPDCADGALPFAGPVQGTDFNFYGVTGGLTETGPNIAQGVFFSLSALALANASPASLAFGNQGINGASAVKKVTLTSSGAAPVTNFSVAVTGANSADFAATTNCPASLKVGAKCTVSVTFTPTLLAPESALLQVTDNAANSPQTVPLSGTGVADATLTPDSDNFGNAPLAIPSTARTFTLKNNLSTALSISAITFGGANPADFSQNGGTCGTSVAGKASCTIKVVFTPSLVGSESATLSISNNAQPPYNSLTSTLSGAGIAQATVSPASVNYPKQKVGTTSAAHKIILKNNLSTALVISGFGFTGADPSDFSVSTSTCGASLASKSTCTVSIVFSPTATGGRAATLNAIDGANNNPQTVSLTGAGD